MITLSFLIITMLLVFNLVFIIKKSKDTAIFAWVIAVFTWIIDYFYIVEVDGLFNIEGLYGLMIGVLAIVSFTLNGMEK